VILNVGKLTPGELKPKIDSLLTCQPAVIGVNLCHFEEDISGLKYSFNGNDKVIFAECNGKSGTLSRVVNEDNSVTHFRHDNNDYFEFKVDFRSNPPFHQRKIVERKNEFEIIHFVDSKKSFHRYELSSIAFVPEFFSGKTVLIGYLGDYVTDSIYYYKDCHITPMDNYYGTGNTPDTYDTEIAANIVYQLDHKNFLNEIELVPRILILLFICIVDVLLLTIIRTRWIALNILLAFTIFILSVLGAGALVVYAFTKDYYLALDELPLILLISSVFTVGLSIFENRKATEKTKK
jgi:hypothetical protein